LNKGESEEGLLFLLLLEETTSDTVICILDWLKETTSDTVICILDWLKETAQTPEGLEQIFDLIIATIQERNRLQEERQVQNKVYKIQIREYKIQVQELIEERDQFRYKLLQALYQQATTRETTLQLQTTFIKSTKILLQLYYI
jgi:hypothetical protein